MVCNFMTQIWIEVRVGLALQGFGISELGIFVFFYIWKWVYYIG
jgi:hypothetical protein